MNACMFIRTNRICNDSISSLTSKIDFDERLKTTISKICRQFYRSEMWICKRYKLSLTALIKH